MQESTLNKLKQFESILKKCLQNRFGKNLPQDKQALINNTEYIDENELKDLKTREEIQGSILRKMLGSIINVQTNKDLHVNDSAPKSIAYGEDLEQGLIEYYAQEIAQKYSFNIDEIPELKENTELIVAIHQVLQEDLDNNALNADAIKMLSKVGLEDAQSKCDKNAIEAYIKKNSAIENLNATPIEEQQKIIEEYTSSKGSLQIVYIDEKKHLKYIDETGEVHLVEMMNDDLVMDFYKKKIQSLEPNQELNVSEFFEELKQITSEEKLTVTEEIETEDLTNSQVNMLSFVQSNKAFKPDVDNGPVTHNNEEQIHVVDATKDIIHTTDHPDLNPTQNIIESKIIKDGSNGMDDTIAHNEVNVEEQKVFLDEVIPEEGMLTQEEYEELCMKYARNEELTPEEYQALIKSTPDLQLEDIEELVPKKSEGPVLSPNGKKTPYYGFGSKNMIMYMTFITVIIGLIFGAVLFILTS